MLQLKTTNWKKKNSYLLTETRHVSNPNHEYKIIDLSLNYNIHNIILIMDYRKMQNLWSEDE